MVKKSKFPPPLEPTVSGAQSMMSRMQPTKVDWGESLTRGDDRSAYQHCFAHIIRGEASRGEKL